MPARGKFRFLDGIAPADAAFEASGADLAEVLEAAARGLFSIIIDIAEVNPAVSRRVDMVADTEEELLYNWLSELVYLKDVKRELYSEFAVSIQVNQGLRLAAEIRGEGIEKLAGKTLTDVKAITYHELAIRRTTMGVTATVVVDL